MADFNKISDEALEDVVGGARRYVYNDSADYHYANVRSGPSSTSSKVYTLSNGSEVFTVDKVYNDEDGYYWTQLDDGNWIASHFLKKY